MRIFLANIKLKKKQIKPDCRITDVDNISNDGYYDINFTKPTKTIIEFDFIS